MNPEIKEQWVTALRSGKYIQGTGRLRRKRGVFLDEPETFCCLGVLCEIAAEAGVTRRAEIERNHYSYDGAGMSPPQSVCDWAWLISPGDPGIHALIDLNDAQKLSFDQIAAYIEETL